ncbi:MAG: peptidylprolyl isomerase [Pseudomonadota bacterium]|nr:peptidylprolyl isomerase [Pseudomonadota bacterium]
MKIEAQRVVSIHYRLSNGQGEVLDSSEGQEPMDFLFGANNIIPGLETALEGLEKGAELTGLKIEANDAYGEAHEALVQEVPRSAFQGVDSIEVGQRFHSQDQNGNPHVVVVKSVTEETVVIDGNHPLAGETLTFDVTVEDVREATQDEIEHSHVHSAGCNH